MATARAWIPSGGRHPLHRRRGRCLSRLRASDQRAIGHVLFILQNRAQRARHIRWHAAKHRRL
eukprot:4359091-Lingulodinium_polyedra.AAC.1